MKTKKNPRAMEVILRKDIEGLGERGERVRVKPGYGRNYLLPSGLAYLASDDAAHRVEAEVRRAHADEEAARLRLEQLVSTLESVEIQFVEKAEGGKLFGSVTTAMIADALTAKLGIAVSPKQVELKHAIKDIGSHEVQVHVHGDSRVRCKVWVLEERPDA
jgi:large subunit ribosomal protein L9